MITFADYMDRVLYGPAGYYSSGTAKSGKSGDYFTAPDVGPVFGQLLAEIFRTWKEKLGEDSFSLMEAGAGEGRLAEDILKTGFSRYIAIDRSPARRESLQKIKERYPNFEIAEGLEALAADPRNGVLFGNELIDAFPVHRARFKGGRLDELYVDESGPKKKFVWKEPSTPALNAYFDRLKIHLPEGYETDVNLAMAGWLRQASSILRKGLLVLIDYGRPAHDYYAPERARGTLRAFSKHKVSADFLDPGAMVDLTADVDFTSLALDARAAGFTPLAFMEMGTFLMMGIRAVVGADLVSARDPNDPNKFRADTRSAPTGLRYLLHPEGLGAAFHVLVLGKEVDPKEWRFEHNRISRLALEHYSSLP